MCGGPGQRGVAAEALRGADAVVALGGGALEDAATRDALGSKTVVLLEVSYPEAVRRAGDQGARPLLTGENGRRRYDERRKVYDLLAGVKVNTEERSPDQVAEEIVRLLGSEAPPRPREVEVAVPGDAYRVVIGEGIASDLDRLLPQLHHAEVAFVVTQPATRAALPLVTAALQRRKLRPVIAEVPDGERAKSLEVAEGLYDELSRAGAHRHDLVLSLGGGVVCDVAGFVSSTYHRGMPVAHVPTTLLAQVDAAIGGKTGVNLVHGKNLVGTIHQPELVVCDVRLLLTLPSAEVTSGLAEVVKYGLIGDPDLLSFLEANVTDVKALKPEVMIELVTRSVEIKARFVERDERERGPRAHLNYGHTFAHALEQASGFEGLRHGEAVAVGIMAAAYLAEELGRMGPGDVEAHQRALGSAGLPTAMNCDLESLEPAWRHDKKYRGGVRFVLLNGLGRPEAGIAVPRPVLQRALERLAP